MTTHTSKKYITAAATTLDYSWTKPFQTQCLLCCTWVYDVNNYIYVKFKWGHVKRLQSFTLLGGTRAANFTILLAVTKINVNQHRDGEISARTKTDNRWLSLSEDRYDQNDKQLQGIYIWDKALGINEQLVHRKQQKLINYDSVWNTAATFCRWIQFLPKQAKTKFLLSVHLH